MGLLSITPRDFAAASQDMVEKQVRRRGISSPQILQALLAVPRHEFVPAEFRADAYADKPLPIGGGQTISQPYMVAAMTEALGLHGDERVLEIGTGSGYHAAVLSLLAREVYSLETDTALALAAQQRLTRLGFANVHVHNGDGSLGFPEGAAYDAILVTAAAPEISPPLVEQLGEEGRLVIPVGSLETQELLRVVKETEGLRSRVVCDCRFVPLRGRFGWQRTPHR